MGKFHIIKGSNDQFYFNLTANNHEVILASEGYTTKQNCIGGIESVKTNAINEENFQKKDAKNGEFYFTIHAANGQVVGVSEMYTTAQSRDNGINAVKLNAPMAEIDDKTL